MTKIMYCCEPCCENNPEYCGRFDRRDLRVLPDGKWICDDCFLNPDVVGEDCKAWDDLPHPPEYVPAARGEVKP